MIYLYHGYVTVIPIVVSAFEIISTRLVMGQENLIIRRQYHTEDSIIKLGQDTEKSFGDLKELAVTQTPVRSPHLIWCEKVEKK